MSEIKKQRKARKPLKKAEPILIPVIRITNPFNTREFVNETLTWKASKTLDRYFPEAPFAVEQLLVISINGKLIPRDQFSSTYLDKTDNLVVCPVPTGGGGGGKQILEIVAMVAVSVLMQPFSASVGGFLTGQDAIGFAGAYGSLGVGVVGGLMTMAGSMLVQSIFAQSPKGNQNTGTTTYGIDGAKTTSTEGVPVPITYGQFRTAGNIVNMYTESDGVTQVLFILINVGEGPISSITNIQLDNNDIETYSNVQTDIRLGASSQTAIPWFDSVLAPHTVGLSLSTTPIYYTTSGEVNGFRLDFTAPNGLFNINTSDGSLNNQTVFLNIEYSVSGANVWTSLNPINQITGTVPVCGVQNTGFTGNDVGNAMINDEGQMFVLDANTGLYTQVTPTTSWYTVTQSEWVQARNLLEFSPSSDNTAVTDPNQIAFLDANFSADPLGAYMYTYGNENLSITSNIQAAYRQSFTSGTLPLATYDIRVSRTTNKSVNVNVVDDIYISDVNEITNQTLTYPNTALLGLRIVLGSQISGIPNVTFMNNGVLVNVWGVPGSFTSTEQWYLSATNNPAWVVWDILTNTRYGAGIETSRLDLEAFKNWAAYCVQEGLTWNGPFDSTSNIWDACQLVLRIGHSQLVSIGTSYTIVTEAPSNPVMMFSVANMIKDTYSETWLSTNDRANDITVNYFDKTDFYKQKSVRIYDPVALSVGASDRTSNVTLYGVDNVATAYREAQFMMNLNRYILKTVAFSAPMEAVACSVGDLIYVQHDMPNYAQAGRFQDGNTASVLQLDRPVTMTAGVQYMLLALHGSQLQYSGVVTNVAGNSIFLTVFDGIQTVNRLVVGGVDTRVSDTFNAGGTSFGVVVDNPAGISIGTAYQLFATDLVEEVNIVNTGTTTQAVTTQSPMIQIPQLYDQWMFGDVNKVKQLFRVISINGGSDYRRDITALQYDAQVYDFTGYSSNGQNLPPLAPSVLAIGPAQSLSLYETTYANGNIVSPDVVASWSQSIVGNYAGAKVYTQTNGGAQLMFADVSGQTICTIPASKGDTITVTVVAYDIGGNTVSIGASPQASINVVGLLPSTINVGGVTGATVDWSGPDLFVSWRYNATTNSYEFGSEPDSAGAGAGSLDPQFMNYQVQVYDQTGTNLRRTVSVASNSFKYSYADNFADGLTRNVQLNIAMRDTSNNIGTPAIVDCVNPPPTLESATAAASYDTATVVYQVNPDPDFKGVAIWLSRNEADISGNISDGSMNAYLAYQGAANSVGLPGLMFSANYYYQIAAFDSLGLVGAIPLGVQEFTTTTFNVQAIAQNALTVNQLSSDLQTSIGLITAGVSTVNSVANQIQVATAAQAAAQAAALANSAAAQAAALTSSAAAQTTALANEAATRGTAITNLSNTTNTALAGLTSSINTLTSETNTNTAAISTNQSTQTTVNNSVAQQLQTLTTNVGANSSAITSNATTAANATAAVASTVNTLTSTVNSNAAIVTTNQSTQTTVNNSVAQQLSTLTSETNANTSSIVSNAQTAANATSAVAATVTALTSTVNANAATVTANATTAANATNAVAATVSALTSTVNGNAATVTTNAQTAANATSAVAATVTALTSTVNGNTASIQTAQQSINGLSAEYTVKIDTNGYVSGFGLANTTNGTTPTSEFLVRADSFGVVMPSYPGVNPFTIGAVNGNPKVIISSAMIGDATINTAMIGNAQVNTLQIGNNSVTVPVSISGNGGLTLAGGSGYVALTPAALTMYLPQAGHITAIITWQAAVSNGGNTNSGVQLLMNGSPMITQDNSAQSGFTVSLVASASFPAAAGNNSFQLNFFNSWTAGNWTLGNWSITLTGTMR